MRSMIPVRWVQGWGVTRENFDVECLKWIDGLHFHTLCEQNADDLEKTLQAVEEKFGEFLSEVSWLNMGADIILPERIMM